MIRFVNPLFLSYWRMSKHSGARIYLGIMAMIFPLIIAALMSSETTSSTERMELGQRLMYVILSAQILFVIIGCWRAINTEVAEEMKLGLLDSNRLSPLTALELMLGYLLGPSFLGLLLFAEAALAGLIVVFIYDMSLAAWLKSQLLLVTTMVFWSLFVLLSVMVTWSANRKSLQQAGWMLPIPLIIFSSMAPLTLIRYILPIDDIFLWVAKNPIDAFSLPSMNSAVYGVTLDTLLLILCIQGIYSIFLIRSLLIRLANPASALVSRFEGLLIFVLTLILQNGLLWSGGVDSAETYLGFSCGLVGMLAVLLALPHSYDPQKAVMAIAGEKRPSFGAFLFSAGSPWVLVLTLIGMIIVAPLYFEILPDRPWNFAILLASAFASSTIILMLIEIGRLQFTKRLRAYLIACFAVLFILPFLIAAVTWTKEMIVFCLPLPGLYALSQNPGSEMKFLIGATGFHLALALAIALYWLSMMRKVFRSSAAQKNEPS